MPRRHVISDLGSAVVDELVRLIGRMRQVPAWVFPIGTVTAWQDNEEYAEEISIFTAIGETLLRDIWLIPAQAIAAAAGNNVRMTFRRRTDAATATVIAQFQTIAADMTVTPMAAYTRYQLSVQIAAGGTAFPAAGVSLVDGEHVTLQVDNVAGGGRPLGGMSVLLDLDPVSENTLVLEPQNLPRYPTFQETARQ